MTEDIVLIDLFSGVGGFAMGLEQAGFNITHHYFSEIDKNAIAVYKYHFKNAEYVGSVEHVSGTEIRAKHPGARIVVSFGWPCQDNSIAGKRKGHVEGTRSNLLLQAVRIISEVQPDYYIAENVKGLYSVNEGVDFIEAIRLLSYLNSDSPQYIVEQQLLNTLLFLPQNRERTYFVGYPTSRGCRQILPIREVNERSNEGTGETASVRTITAGGNSGGMHSSMTLIKEVTNLQGKDIANTIRSGGRGSLTDKHNLDMVKVGVIQLNSSKESGGKQPYQQNRIYSDKGVSPTLDGKSGVWKIIQSGRGFNKGGEHDVCPTTSSNSFEQNNVVGYKRTPLKFLDRNGKNTDGDYAFTIDSCGTGGIEESHPDKIKVRRLTEIEVERLQGFPDEWTKYGLFEERPKRKDLLFRESNPELWAYHTKMVNKGDVVLREIATTQRYKQMGNAVSVPVVKAVGERILNDISCQK